MSGLANPYVVLGHRPNPRRLHRSDCPHCVPSTAYRPTKLVPATPQEARTIRVCHECAVAEAKATS